MSESELDAKNAAWRAVSTAERAALLDRCVAAIGSVSERWAAAEDWLVGPLPAIRYARLLAATLRHPALPSLRTRRDGRVIAHVFPTTATERLLFAGMRGDVWIEREKPASQGSPRKRDARVGGSTSIDAINALHKLFIDDEVALLPIAAPLRQILAEALAPLIEEGWLAVVDGDHAAPDPGLMPVLVVPGPWSEADLEHYARRVAAMIARNERFKVVIVAKQWLQRAAFLGELAERCGIRDFGQDEDPVRDEAFRGRAAIVTIDAPALCGVDVSRFIDAAVRFANDRCAGTTSCIVLAHPATQEAHSGRLARALEELRYGTIGVNVWPWGFYPGLDVVHDPFLLDHSEKAILRAPFRVLLDDHPNRVELGRRLVAFETAPSWGALVHVASAGLRLTPRR
jgi:hypothetical protein